MLAGIPKPKGVTPIEHLPTFYALGLSLAQGLLIGLERGWKEREQAEGARVAGIRTFGLIGLLGGVWGVLADELGVALLAVAFALIGLVLIAAHAVSQLREPRVGITGVVAGLLTFAFGAMATLGFGTIAAVGAVVTTLLLGAKPTLHAWVRRLEEPEFYATLKLLVISVVILPLLPNESFGPWEALNPYQIWWMVVLVAGISYVGYFAMKIVGERKGIVFTGLFAGLASSTAATVHFARLARSGQASGNILAAGILVASATMFPRVLVIAAVFSWSLTTALLWPMLAMMAVNYLAAAFFWHRSQPWPSRERARIANPFELKPALVFAALLTAIMLLSRALADRFGDAGIYLLAAFSGMADLAAITLSLVNMVDDPLRLSVAALAILIAAFVNALVKAGLALGIGGLWLGIRIGLATLLVILTGVTTWFLV